VRVKLTFSLHSLPTTLTFKIHYQILLSIHLSMPTLQPPPLIAKVSFTRLVLEGEKSVNPNENVTVEQELSLTNQVSPTNTPVVSKPLDDVIAAASRRFPIKPPLRTSSETIMVTNLLRPINSQQH